MFLLDKSYWEVRHTKKKGRGIFAKKAIPAGTIIGDYIGKVIKTAEEDIYEKDESLYLMYYHDQASIYPNLSKTGIHLLNHSCTPNSWMYTYHGHTLFFTIRHVFPGEEITISYLLSPMDSTCKPCKHLCHCEGIICYQTMHLPDKKYDTWSSFNDAQGKKTKKKRVAYGKTLAKLDSYPDNLPDNALYNLFGSTGQKPKVMQDKKLPPIIKLREMIRQTGKTIKFPFINVLVLGIEDNTVISKTLKARKYLPK